MAGRIAAPGRQSATRVTVEVVDRIPAVDADVAAAEQRHLAIDDHDLLVMAGAGRQGVVEMILDLGAREEGRAALGAEQLGRRDRERHRPGQDPHVEIGVQRRLATQQKSDAIRPQRIAAALDPVRIEPR